MIHVKRGEAREVFLWAPQALLHGLPAGRKAPRILSESARWGGERTIKRLPGLTLTVI